MAGSILCSWGRGLGVLSSGSILLLAWETECSGEVQVTVRTVAGFVQNIRCLLSTGRPATCSGLKALPPVACKHNGCP